MVCMPGHVKMASMLKLVMTENHTAPDEAVNEMNAAQVLQKQLFDAHEPNLLNEDDMHIFGSKPMADPLDLVCCSTCKKPLKASQYAAHAERCSSGKVNTNDSMGVDCTGPTKPPKKGRKIKLASNGNQKVHIKVKAASPSNCRNSAKGFELDNVHVSKVQPIDSTVDQRLKTSVDNAPAVNVPESRFRDAPVPLATKMYHSQGNYRLRVELGQLYRESCAEHLGSYSTPNLSQENGLMVARFPACENQGLHGAQKTLVPQTKYLDQLPANISESCSGTPQQSAANPQQSAVSPQLSAACRPNRLKETKAERGDTQAFTFKHEVTRARCNRAAVPSSKNKDNKKAQQQPNGRVS